MATLKSNGNEVYKVVSPGTSGLSVNTVVNSTGVTVNSPFSDLKMNRQADVVVPASMAITGDWASTQYVSTAVDTTGLIFTITMSDNTTKTVTPTSYSPTTWSSTAGTQTCTFTYTESGVSVTAQKSANVIVSRVTDLNGTTWRLNDPPLNVLTIEESGHFNIAASTTFQNQTYSDDRDRLHYYNTIKCYNFYIEKWDPDAGSYFYGFKYNKFGREDEFEHIVEDSGCRTFTFGSGSDSTNDVLINWLYDNATLQS